MRDNKQFYNLSDDQIFEILGDAALLFHKLIPIPNTIAITDREKFAHYVRGSDEVL
ncbi:hypothetical protein [Desulfosporosinus sp. SB140]|uniref:hypothetical protein n=1 Tax=Desulfosporosinus paludis TaxID=3115649 RepID=UPI00388EE9EC